MDRWIVINIIAIRYYVLSPELSVAFCGDYDVGTWGTPLLP